jgi:hypothetical protein
MYDGQIGDAERLALLALTFGFALTIISYEYYADHKGWPVGAMYRNRTSLLNIFAAFCLFGALAITLNVLPWWMLFVVIFAGFFAGLSTVQLLKERAQLVAPAGLVACWIADILFVLP